MNVINETLKSRLPLVVNTIDFFTAFTRDKEEFERIKKICIDCARTTLNADTFIKVGELSVNDFVAYHSYTKNKEQPIRFEPELVTIIIKKLCELGVLLDSGDFMVTYSVVRRYKSSGFNLPNRHIINALLGFEYICNTYSNSVLMIEPIMKDDSLSIGTGFYIKYKEHHLVITNKHVVENAKKLTIFNKTNIEIKYLKVIKSSKTDIACFILKEEILQTIPFVLTPHSSILSEIITIGYPSIPLTKEPYQLIHKGEINNLAVSDYWENQYLLFSAKTSSGNSGSPVINSFGYVIGMVTQEFFEQEGFLKKGKLPYYAAIPTSIIAEFLKNEIS